MTRIRKEWLLLLAVVTAGCGRPSPQQPARPLMSDSPRVAFDVACGGDAWGTIVFELDAVRAPETTANFLKYVDDGYYDGTIIHRVIVGENVRIQVMQGGGYTELNGPAKPGQRPPIRNEGERSYGLLTQRRGPQAGRFIGRPRQPARSTALAGSPPFCPR